MIDLHLHLDGSLSPQAVIRLAEREGVTLPADTPKGLMPYLRCPAGCTSLDEYLTRFELPLSVLQTDTAVSEAVYLLCEKLFSDGMLYAEIRFAPQLHISKGFTQSEIVRAAVSGLHRSGFFANLILCCMRGAAPEVNLETVRVAGEFLGKGVAALDLAGAEGLYSTESYREIFEIAADNSIPFIIHAGEADGPDSVRAALSMGARRIGHGISAAYDAELLSLLQKRQTPIEVCPTSNCQTGAVDRIENHPVKKFLDMGLCVTVNTDNMTVSDTSTEREFALLSRVFGFGERERAILLSNAVSASFLSDNEKCNLMNRLFG